MALHFTPARGLAPVRWDWVWEVPGSTSADPILCSILSLGKLGLLVFVLARTKCLISVSRNKPEQPLSMQLGSPTEMNKNKINTLSWCIQNREIMFSTVEYKNKLFRWVKSNQHESYFFGNVKHWWTYVKLLLNYHYMTLFYIIKHNLTFFTGTYYYSFFIKSSFYQPFLASRNNSMSNNKDMSNRDFFLVGTIDFIILIISFACSFFMLAPLVAYLFLFIRKQQFNTFVDGHSLLFSFCLLFFPVKEVSYRLYNSNHE